MSFIFRFKEKMLPLLLPVLLFANYLLSLSTDSLLYAWRQNAGLAQPPGVKPLRYCFPMPPIPNATDSQ